MSQLPTARAAQRRLDMEARGASPFERRGCLDKRAYVTRKGARRAARQLLTGGKAHGHGKLSPYKCGHCGLFHLTKVENHYRRRSAGGGG